MDGFCKLQNCRSLIREFLRNLRAATVEQAGPADVNGEVELDGEALLYCEALLASEASPLSIGDSAGEPEQVSDGQDAPFEQPDILLPVVVPPAILPPAVVPPAILPPGRRVTNGIQSCGKIFLYIFILIFLINLLIYLFPGTTI
ncbi:uncharacterized protein LOC116931797 [Daphnia magna]|uniref:uncharacterized protein LOC116931797 n=1 Tax=Daphnia magna TaxID=35525 RepID=UPI001401CE2F|nr:uncharacterized protein LOC116931797 [Daphnia magna]